MKSEWHWFSDWYRPCAGIFLKFKTLVDYFQSILTRSQESLYWFDFIFVRPINIGCTCSCKCVFLFTSQLGRGKSRADSCPLSPWWICYSIWLRASHVEFPQVGAGQGAQDRGRGQWGMQAVCFHMQLSSSVRTFLMSSSETFAAF